MIGRSFFADLAKSSLLDIFFITIIIICTDFHKPSYILRHKRLDKYNCNRLYNFHHNSQHMTPNILLYTHCTPSPLKLYELEM